MRPVAVYASFGGVSRVVVHLVENKRSLCERAEIGPFVRHTTPAEDAEAQACELCRELAGRRAAA